MNYKRAEEWIPQELLIKLQEYVDGEYLYIPRKSNHHKTWGEKNGYKKKLTERNKEIAARRYSGETVEQLAKIYFLSEKSIYRILSEQEEKN
ncbi:MAG: CD3324 family protein [Eubacterium sp.]|nr:CD3324 family protein [Eubacterium sp.]